MRRKRIVVNDLMQTDFVYFLTEPVGRNFHPDFQPELSPAEMLALGVFGGKYMTDCRREFPDDWFHGAKLCHQFHDPELNFFGINASQPLWYWREKGWIDPADPRLVPVVLPLLSGPPGPGRCPANPPLEGYAKTHCPGPAQLPPRRSRLPAQAASGAAALGL